MRSTRRPLLDDGEPKRVISGGEEDIANLALRLAISQMIAERAGQPLSLLILDEIFGSLDEEHRAAVVELLRSLADRFPQVILITHIDSVRDGFDRIVRVDVRRSARRRPWWPTSSSRGTMWRPDRSVHGPDRATLDDVEPLNRLFTEAFTDRYRARRAHRRPRAATHAARSGATRRGCRRGRDALARFAMASWPRSTWCTSPAPKGGWGQSPCDQTGRAPGRPRGRTGRR